MCWQMFYASQNKEPFFPYTALTVVSFNGEELSVRHGGDRVLIHYVFVFRLQRINKDIRNLVMSILKTCSNSRLHKM
jgi:hypothetical protein